jgi:hypothetical protein
VQMSLELNKMPTKRMVFRSCSEGEHIKERFHHITRGMHSSDLPYSGAVQNERGSLVMLVRLRVQDMIKRLHGGDDGLPRFSSILHRVRLQKRNRDPYMFPSPASKRDAWTATCVSPKYPKPSHHVLLALPKDGRRLRMLHPAPQTHRGSVPVIRIIITTIGRR